jgi:hypothetical protein
MVMSQCTTSSCLGLGFTLICQFVDFRIFSLVTERNWKGVDRKCPHTPFSSYLGMWKTVERRMTALANCVLRAASAGVRLGWWLAGGSEVRAAEDDLRWSLAE